MKLFMQTSQRHVKVGRSKAKANPRKSMRFQDVMLRKIRRCEVEVQWEILEDTRDEMKDGRLRVSAYWTKKRERGRCISVKPP